MMSVKARLSAAVSGLAIAAAFAAIVPAAAQTAGSTSGDTIHLDTIDVNGQRRETATGPIDGYVATRSAAGTKTSTPLNETPQSIAVVGAKQIEDQKAQTIDEATRYSPGIHSQTFGADPRNDWFLIRGFNEQTTGYYLDGLQLFSTSFATYKLEPWNLERIEVVRGPSAVLYGGGDPGGIINAVSKRPTFTTFGEIETGVNAYGNVYSAVDLGGVAGANKEWSYRFISIGRIGGTQTDHTDEDRAFVAPSLTYDSGDGTTFTLLGQYQHDKTNGQNFLPYAGTVTPAPYGRIPTSLFTSDPSIDTFKRDQAMLGYEFEHVFSPSLTVRQNMRYSHLDVDYQTLYGLGYDGSPANAELSRGNFVTTPHADQVDVDTQAEVRFNTYALQHIALFGIDYKHYDLRDSQGFAFGPDLNLLNPVYSQQTVPTSRYIDNDTVQDQLGFYAQDQMKFNRLTFVVAGREDFVDTSVDNKLAPAASTETKPNAFSGKVGAVYNFDSGVAPYVSYSTSFNPILGTKFGNVPYSPETGEQEEVGVKYQSPSLPITASVALFNLTRDNALTADPDHTFFSIQTGQQRSRGVEFGATANLADGLSLIGAYTAYDLTVTKDTNPALIGKVPTNTPEQFGSLWLDYTLQDSMFHGLGFGAGVRYTGRSFADNLDTLPVPDFVLGDAAIHYERNQWRAALNVSNIADTTYVGSCSSPTACFYGDRRKITLSVAYKW